MKYDAANEFLKKRLTLPTELRSKGISDALPPAVRAHCFFSARVAEARVLQQIRKVSDAFSRGDLGLSEARTQLQKWLDNKGIGDPSSAAITNISGSMRLNLILRQNAAMAAAVGRYQVSRDPDIEERWPSWKYITGSNPRPEHAALNGKIFLKSDPFWKTHYPPWDFNCNCDVEDSDEEPQKAPPHDDRAPASGFQFDPAEPFREFDMSSIEDERLRKRVVEKMRKKFGKIDKPEKKEKAEKLSPEEHKAHRREQLARAKENRLKREAEMLNSELISGEHTAENDLKMTNPNYKLGNEYRINCQRCITAYEARRRGIDVEARPAPRGDMLNRVDGWSFAYSNPKITDCSAPSGIAARNKIIKEMSAMPDGARCAVQVIWKGRSYSGHVFIAEKQNGKIRFIDPQPCGQNDQSDCFDYFENATGKLVHIMRLDNRKFSDTVKECCERRSK